MDGWMDGSIAEDGVVGSCARRVPREICEELREGAAGSLAQSTAHNTERLATGKRETIWFSLDREMMEPIIITVTTTTSHGLMAHMMANHHSQLCELLLSCF